MHALQHGSVLIVSNHTSWWDPMMCIYLGHRVWQADGFALMNAANLRRFPFLGRVGGVGVEPDDAEDGRQVITYLTQLLKTRGRLVWIFPQGQEQRGRHAMDEFKPGAAIICKKAPATRLIPVGLRYEFGATEHPEIFVAIGEPLPPSFSIRSQRQAQQQAVEKLLEQIDERLRHGPDAADSFELLWQKKPSRMSLVAQNLLSRLTRY
jgi:1-acyl-sn-glycerol-3-phosphate acyltransferase